MLADERLESTAGAARAAAVRLRHWLLHGPAQLSDGRHCGGVAGGISAGAPVYVYAEITGYFLHWLADLTHVESREIVSERARRAIDWTTRQFAAGRVPPTRAYLDAAADRLAQRCSVLLRSGDAAARTDRRHRGGHRGAVAAARRSARGTARPICGKRYFACSALAARRRRTAAALVDARRPVPGQGQLARCARRWSVRVAAIVAARLRARVDALVVRGCADSTRHAASDSVLRRGPAPRRPRARGCDSDTADALPRLAERRRQPARERVGLDIEAQRHHRAGVARRPAAAPARHCRVACRSLARSPRCRIARACRPTTARSFSIPPRRRQSRMSGARCSPSRRCAGMPTGAKTPRPRVSRHSCEHRCATGTPAPDCGNTLVDVYGGLAALCAVVRCRARRGHRGQVAQRPLARSGRARTALAPGPERTDSGTRHAGSACRDTRCARSRRWPESTSRPKSS